ncbi:MAG TPA: tetratricopeptide repeat protein, partial [Lacipirellulaceae bacterium]|nr:tetratricopeptide repeat protein [Lacipirellulaceae bacterium]
FRDRTTMLGIYLGAIAAYSAVRFFTAQPNDRMFSGDLASAHQWLIAAFVASSLLHFYYDGFIWKVSESRTRETLAAAAPAASSTLASQLHTPALVHGAKWATLAAIAAVLIAAERQYDGKPRAVRDAQQRAALITLTPGVPEAAMLASQDASARGDKAKAVAQARLAARARPGSHRSQAELAWALLEVREYAEARTAIEAALAIAPDSWDYQCDLGEICERLGDDEDAEAAYRRALQLGAQEQEPWLRWSDFLLRRTRTEEAAAAVDSLLALDPQGAEGSYRLGLVQLHRGDARAAVAPLRRAVAKDPRHFQAWLQLGDALMALGKSEPAARAYQRAVELRPEVSVAWVCWADSLLQSGLTGEAETTLRSGLAATPDSPELCLTLGLLLQQSGRAEEAAHLLRRAEELGLRVPAEQSEVDRADR